MVEERVSSPDALLFITELNIQLFLGHIGISLVVHFICASGVQAISLSTVSVDGIETSYIVKKMSSIVGILSIKIDGDPQVASVKYY